MFRFFLSDCSDCRVTINFSHFVLLFGSFGASSLAASVKGFFFTCFLLCLSSFIPCGFLLFCNAIKMLHSYDIIKRRPVFIIADIFHSG